MANTRAWGQCAWTEGGRAGRLKGAQTWRVDGGLAETMHAHKPGLSSVRPGSLTFPLFALLLPVFSLQQKLKRTGVST